MSATNEEIENFLEHFGVKGMKWGVHQEKRLRRARRVSDGIGTRFDRFLMRGSQSQASIMRSAFRREGDIGLAKRTVISLEQRKERMQNGETKVRDALDKYGLLRTNKINKKLYLERQAKGNEVIAYLLKEKKI